MLLTPQINPARTGIIMPGDAKRGRRGGSGWTPAILFAADDVGLWTDAALSVLFQNNAGTTAATAAAQPIARANDLTGRGNNLLQSTGGLRPITSSAPVEVRRNKLNYGSDLTMPNPAWSKGPAATVANAGQDGPNGNPAQVITYSGTTSTANVFQQIPVTAGQTITASIYVKAGTAPDLTLRLIDGDGVAIRTALSITPTGTWTRYSVTGTMATTGNAQIALRGSSVTAGTVLVSDAQFEVGSTPTPYQFTAAASGAYQTIPQRNFAVGSANVGSATYWPASTTWQGVTATKIGSGNRASDGRFYVRYRVQGTATATSGLTLQPFNQWQPAVSSGQSWVFSCTASIVAGTPNAGSYGGFRLEAVGETNAGAYTEGLGTGWLTATVDTNLTAAVTLSNASTQRLRCALVCAFTTGQVINYTVEVVEPQLERGSTRTTYQPNYSPYEYAETGYPSYPGLYFDRVDDAMTATLASALTGDELVIGRAGYRVTSKSVTAGGTYTLSPAAAVGDVIAVLLRGRSFSAAEIAQAVGYYATRGGGSGAV